MAQSSERAVLGLGMFIFVSNLSANPRISGKQTDQASKPSLDRDVWDGVREAGDGDEVRFGYPCWRCSYGGTRDGRNRCHLRGDYGRFQRSPGLCQTCFWMLHCSHYFILTTISSNRCSYSLKDKGIEAKKGDATF